MPQRIPDCWSSDMNAADFTLDENVVRRAEPPPRIG